MLYETEIVKLRNKSVKVVDALCVNAVTPNLRSPSRLQSPELSLVDLDPGQVTSDLLQRLPISLLLDVLSHLNAFDLLQFSCTSKANRQSVLSNWQLWLNLIKRNKDLVLFKHKKFVKPQTHCNHCSAGAFQLSPTCPSQALRLPKETKELLDRLQYPDWIRGYIRTHGLVRNWTTGRYHPINSRCHTKHVSGVVANEKSILSCGKDGYVFMYSRDFFVHYKLIKLDSPILCMQLVQHSMICFVDSNGFLHLVNVPPKLPSSPNEPPASKFWTCPIADSDTKCLILTELTQIENNLVDVMFGNDGSLKWFSFLAVCVSYHGTVSVVRVVINQSEIAQIDSNDPLTSKAMWPNIENIHAVEIVQRFTIASDDTERVFLFTSDSFKSQGHLDSDKLLFVSSYDCPIRIYHLMSAECLVKVSDVCDVVYCGQYNKSKRALYTGGADGKIVVWTLNVVREGNTQNGVGQGVDQGGVGVEMVESVEQMCSEMCVSLWCDRVMSHGPEVYCLSYFTHPHTADEVHVVTGGSDGDVRIWHSLTGHLMRILKGHVGIVRQLVVLRGKLLISTGDQKRIIIWNLAVSKTMQGVANISDALEQPSNPLAALEPRITDANLDDDNDAIVLHRNPLCIDSLFVDDFSIFIGSPDYPGSVGAILFW